MHGNVITNLLAQQEVLFQTKKQLFHRKKFFTMKTKINIILVLFTNFLFAQIAIEKDSLSSPSVSLEFGNANKGLVVPWATSEKDVETAGVVPGSIIYDLKDNNLKVYRSIQDPMTGSHWFSYSIKPPELAPGNTVQIDSSLQDNLTENPTARVIITSDPVLKQDPSSDTTNGVLILSDTDKAMILPKVALPEQNIINPAAGMMVFDTERKLLMIFDGVSWTYWMPDSF